MRWEHALATLEILQSLVDKYEEDVGAIRRLATSDLEAKPS